MKVLGVVTARGGSKGVPGKNLKPLLGKPLILHTIEAARAAGVFDRVILSTDDLPTAEMARRHGCEVPFMRPAELATDETLHLPVMQHAVAWLRDHDGYWPDYVMILQPTSPLRQPAHIREAVDLIGRTGADSVVSVQEVPAHYNPMRAVSVDKAGAVSLFVTGEPLRRRVARRQDLPKAWMLNTAIYLFRTAVLFDPVEPSLYGDRVMAYVMSSTYSHGIDGPEDWDIVERTLQSLELASKPGRQA